MKLAQPTSASYCIADQPVKEKEKKERVVVRCSELSQAQIRQ